MRFKLVYDKSAPVKSAPEKFAPLKLDPDTLIFNNFNFFKSA